jgi:pyruvate/2-oxoglutarate dehydrogenase complex dihydrolipoamide dehydrogenase (E3) component
MENYVPSDQERDLQREGRFAGPAGGGIRVGSGRPGDEHASVSRRKRKMVDGLREMHLDRFKASGAELIMGEARFIGPKTVEVGLANGGSRAVEAERVFLSLGTRSSVPDVPGLAAAQPMTHVEALDLYRLPPHLVILGGGYIGLEFAQALRRFGWDVTVIERGPRLASREDPDVGAALFELFRDEGIEVLLETTVHEVSGRSGQSVRLAVEGPNGKRDIGATDVLIAAGRIPNTEFAGLDKAGVALDARGYIEVNHRLETSAENVWAMGDCARSPQFTHAAFDDFHTVRENLKGGNRSTRGRLVPFCLFTDPELVRIGLNETEAKRLNVGYRLAGVLRTRTVSEPRGFMKDVDR